MLRTPTTDFGRGNGRLLTSFVGLGERLINCLVGLSPPPVKCDTSPPPEPSPVNCRASVVVPVICGARIALFGLDRLNILPVCMGASSALIGDTSPSLRLGSRSFRDMS